MMGKEISSTTLIALATVMAALVCITTMLIQIPIPATEGYFNIGDAMIMIAALTGGPIVGAFAGGIGASLADLFGGYYVYIIPTLIIKGLEGFLAGWILSRGEQNLQKMIIAWIIGGFEMVLGYFLFQVYMFGFSAAFYAEFPVNFTQMIVGGAVGIPVAQALKRMIRI